MELNIQNAVDVINGFVFLQRFPTFLKTQVLSLSFFLDTYLEYLISFVTHFIKDPARNSARGMQYLGPIIEERQKCLDKFGDSWVEKPVRRTSLVLPRDLPSIGRMIFFRG
jgi:hypothetical protein